MRKKNPASARRKAVQRRSRETVDAILEAAIRILTTKSLATTTTTTEIAEKAGVSIGSLYEYFSDKKELFLRVIKVGRSPRLIASFPGWIMRKIICEVYRRSS